LKVDDVDDDTAPAQSVMAFQEVFSGHHHLIVTAS